MALGGNSHALKRSNWEVGADLLEGALEGPGLFTVAAKCQVAPIGQHIQTLVLHTQQVALV